jgi:cell division protein FtsB
MFFRFWVALVVVVALGLILFLVLPTRTWLAQRAALSDAQHRLSVISAENEALAARVAALRSPAEVERLARQQYGMIRPGEKPYSVLPAAPPGQLPASWPYSIVQGILDSRAAGIQPSP